MSVTMYNGLVGRSTMDRKTDTTLAPEQHLLIRKGDIAYNMMRMWQGASGLAHQDGIVSPAYVVLAPRDNIDPLFASYWFKSARMIYLFWAYSYGITRDRLRLYYDDFARIPACIPSLKEQMHIGKVLQSVDAAIEKTGKLIEAKKKLKEALAQKLLTGKKRFKEFKGQAWRMGRLSDHVTTFSGGTPSRNQFDYFGGDIPWIKSTEVNQREIAYTEEYITEMGWENSAAKMVEPGTLLYALYGATAGIPAVCRIRAAINQAVLAIIPGRALDGEYLYHYLDYHREQILSRYVQGGQPNLSAEIVKELRVALPSTEEQMAIASLLRTCDTELGMLRSRANSMERQKKGLMQKLLTGKIRVKV